MIKIQTQLYDLAKEIEQIKSKSSSIGALVVFEGIARDNSHGQKVIGLEFECYESMAMKKLQEIEDQAKNTYDVIDIVMIHRMGPISISEGIVFILVTSMHRDAAYQASRFCIDTLKQTVPIWKKEFTASGETWVTCCP